MATPFIGVYTALYDYQAQNDEELSISENDVLYLLQRSDFDDWWLVKRRVIDANEEEPQGLVPNTYIAEMQPLNTCVALYDYEAQTDEELSFNEGQEFDLYDDSDPNWALVGIGSAKFGFVPGNYIEKKSETAATIVPAPTIATTVPPITTNSTAFPDPSLNVNSSFPPPPQRLDRKSSPPKETSYQQQRGDYTGDYDAASEEEQEEVEAPPPMPNRPNQNSYANDYDDAYQTQRPPSNRSRSNTNSSRRKSFSNILTASSKNDENLTPIHGDFAWKVIEYDNKEKNSGILEIGNFKVYLEIENKNFNEQWPIANLMNYNSEKKHIFLDFKSPSYSFDLKVSSKDSAEAIMSILGDMKGMQSQSALTDLKKAQSDGIKAANAAAQHDHKKGVLLYDFEGADDDELSCKEGDIVYIVNDKKSKEWWMVKNQDGEKGIVPSNYIKIVSSTKDARLTKSSSGGFLKNLLGPHDPPRKTKKSSKERDREERELREVARMKHERDEMDKKRRAIAMKENEKMKRDKEQRERVRRADERLRERRLRDEAKKQQSNSTSSAGADATGTTKEFNKPNPHRVRTWIDRSGSFKVEAEFLGVQHGKIHLHKTNGVVIGVAANKLSTEDLEYVEKLTGTSLDKYKPQDEKKDTMTEKSPQQPTSQAQPQQPADSTPSLPSRESSSAVARQRTNVTPLRADLVDYWFNLCVEAGVDVSVCDRYARNFAQEQLDESVIDGVTPALLRTLGIREGDILKIRKKINLILGVSTSPTPPPVSAAPAIGKNVNDPLPNTPATNTPGDDDWASRPAIKTGVDSAPNSAPSAATGSSNSPSKNLTPQITGSIQDLLDIKPMQPTRTGITPIKPVSTIGGEKAANEPASMSSTVTGGATNPLSAANTGFNPMVAMPTGFVPIGMIPMLTGMTTGMMPIRTGGLNGALTGGFNSMPITTFGAGNIGSINSLAQQPVTSFNQQQKTGNGSYIMPLNNALTGGMPITSFGGQPMMNQITGNFNNMHLNSSITGNGNGLVKLQPTGVKLQPTSNGLFNTSQVMQPTMKTGGTTFVPQSNFGMQITGGGMNMMNGMATGSMPMTSFGNMNAMATGGFPQTSFGGNNMPMMNNMATGGMPMMNTMATGGMPMMNTMATGGMPTTSFGNMNPMATGGFPQTSFGMNTSAAGTMNAMATGNMPMTSFGGPAMNQMQTGNYNQMNGLQPQSTGFGFGNSGTSSNGQANLAKATADNPFGF